MVYAIDARKKAGRQEFNKVNIKLYDLHRQIAFKLSDEEEQTNFESIENLYATSKGFDTFSSAFNFW